MHLQDSRPPVPRTVAGPYHFLTGYKESVSGKFVSDLGQEFCLVRRVEVVQSRGAKDEVGHLGRQEAERVAQPDVHMRLDTRAICYVGRSDVATHHA